MIPPTFPNRRRLAASLALFAVIMLVGALPISAVRRGYAQAFCGVANPLFSRLTFGRGGHGQLAAVTPTQVRRPGDHVTADAVISLSVEGVTGQIGLEVSLRRDSYLPLLLLVALVVAVPLGARRKLRCLAIGVPTMCLLTFAALWLLVAWQFAFGVRGVYELGATARFVLDLAFRTLLMPPGNRFIAPVLLAACLTYWQSPWRLGQKKGGDEVLSSPPDPDQSAA